MFAKYYLVKSKSYRHKYRKPTAFGRDSLLLMNCSSGTSSNTPLLSSRFKHYCVASSSLITGGESTPSMPFFPADSIYDRLMVWFFILFLTQVRFFEIICSKRPKCLLNLFSLWYVWEPKILYCSINSIQKVLTLRKSKSY